MYVVYLTRRFWAGGRKSMVGINFASTFSVSLSCLLFVIIIGKGGKIGERKGGLRTFPFDIYLPVLSLLLFGLLFDVYVS